MFTNEEENFFHEGFLLAVIKGLKQNIALVTVVTLLLKLDKVLFLRFRSIMLLLKLNQNQQQKIISANMIPGYFALQVKSLRCCRLVQLLSFLVWLGICIAQQKTPLDVRLFLAEQRERVSLVYRKHCSLHVSQAFCCLVWCEVSLPTVGELEFNDPFNDGPFQPKLFYSVICKCYSEFHTHFWKLNFPRNQ